MLKRYGEELQSVFDELIRMASYAVGAVRKAQAALEMGDAAAAKNITSIASRKRSNSARSGSSSSISPSPTICAT